MIRCLGSAFHKQQEVKGVKAVNLSTFLCYISISESKGKDKGLDQAPSSATY